jgi:hypothetical protein
MPPSAESPGSDCDRRLKRSVCLSLTKLPGLYSRGNPGSTTECRVLQNPLVGEGAYLYRTIAPYLLRSLSAGAA